MSGEIRKYSESDLFVFLEVSCSPVSTEFHSRGLLYRCNRLHWRETSKGRVNFWSGVSEDPLLTKMLLLLLLLLLLLFFFFSFSLQLACSSGLLDNGCSQLTHQAIWVAWEEQDAGSVDRNQRNGSDWSKFICNLSCPLFVCSIISCHYRYSGAEARWKKAQMSLSARLLAWLLVSSHGASASPLLTSHHVTRCDLLSVPCVYSSFSSVVRVTRPAQWMPYLGKPTPLRDRERNVNIIEESEERGRGKKKLWLLLTHFIDRDVFYFTWTHIAYAWFTLLMWIARINITQKYLYASGWHVHRSIE